jgi:hypothetical protein
MKRASKKELDAARRQNFIERLKFIDSYAAWVKKTPNKVWSRQLAKMLDG